MAQNFDQENQINTADQMKLGGGLCDTKVRELITGTSGSNIVYVLGEVQQYF